MAIYGAEIGLVGVYGRFPRTGFPELEKERTKTVRMIFHRDQLLDDAQQLSFVLGDVKKADDEHDRHQLMDIVEDGNVDRVTRVLNTWIAKCREVLYPYTKVEVEDGTVRTDTLNEAQDYIIEMLVPDGYSKTTVNYLTELIHELLVCRVMEDWVSIADPGKQEIWKEKAEFALNEINRVKNGRIAKVRRKQHPFP